jgi:pheromone shutdown protein TraB
MIWAWTIPNAVMAAICTVIAGGRPLTVLTAAVASPITSLNPLVAAGFVAGLVEAWLRKPTVADAERINDDVQSIRGLYSNAFTRVLLVVFLANLGSALGAWIGAAFVFTAVTGEPAPTP